KRHAFEGCSLAVISKLQRRGVFLLLVILPDGSRSLIPATWTDFQDPGQQPAPPQETDGSLHSICSLRDLLQVRAVIDALLGRLSESATQKEGSHAAEPGVYRSTGGTEEAVDPSLGSTGSDSSGRSARNTLTHHRTYARGKTARGGPQ